MVGKQLWTQDPDLQVSAATGPAGTLPPPGCGLKRWTPAGLYGTPVQGPQPNQGWKGGNALVLF